MKSIEVILRYVSLILLIASASACAPRIRTTTIRIPIPKDQAQREWLEKERDIRLDPNFTPPPDPSAHEGSEIQ